MKNHSLLKLMVIHNKELYFTSMMECSWWAVVSRKTEAAECLQHTNEKLASCSLECQKLQQDLCHWVHFEAVKKNRTRKSRIPRHKKWVIIYDYVVHYMFLIVFV